MDNIIVFENVEKNFGKSKVIRHASFGIKEHSICGFIGPNGAGKTTIIKLLLSIIPQSAGTITIRNNIPINKIGTIVGGPAYYEHLDAYKNIRLVAYMKKININNIEIEKLLQMVGLFNVGSKKIANFSLGMKQRLSIAMSLVGNPEILIWDEPINGLDPEGIIDVRNLIHKIHDEQNVTFLISSHILSELDKVIDNLILIKQGEIIYNGSFEEFTKEYQQNSLEESYIMCMNKDRSLI